MTFAHNSLPAILGWISVTSAFIFLISLIVVPLIIIRIPTDYFQHRSRRRGFGFRGPRPVFRASLLIAKNLLAAILVIGGVLMLVLPGQGLLTILIGVGISDFPGKYRLERKLVAAPGILTAMNWIRGKAQVALLHAP